MNLHPTYLYSHPLSRVELTFHLFAFIRAVLYCSPLLKKQTLWQEPLTTLLTGPANWVGISTPLHSLPPTRYPEERERDRYLPDKQAQALVVLFTLSLSSDDSQDAIR